MANVRTIKRKLARLGAGQEAALRRALGEMLAEGCKLTRDALKARAKVSTGDATLALQAYRAGCFSIEPPAPASGPPAHSGADLRKESAAERAEHLGVPACFAGAPLVMDLEDDTFRTASYLAAIANPRRRAAILKMASLMYSADVRDQAEHESDEAICAALGLDWYEAAPDDAGLAALAERDLPSSWESACLGTPAV